MDSWNGESRLHPTISAILQCQEEAGIEITEEQRATFVRRLGATLGGGAVYFPKRAARPSGNFVTHIGPSSTVVRELQVRYGVSRATGYRWIGRK
jgi:hypothetical protein